MKFFLITCLVFLSNFSFAQKLCLTENFNEFQKEDRLRCKNLVVANLSFMNDGYNVYPIGQTAILDSIAIHMAQNEYIYEIDYETKDEKITNEQKSTLEIAIRNYLIRKNSANQVKVFQEGHDKIDHTSNLPSNMNSGFFFIAIYPDR